MIEVNLLPPEYRPRDKTNLPLVASLALGILVMGGILLYGYDLSQQVNRLKSRNDELTAERNQFKAIADEVDRIQKEIDRQKTRQQTIVEISQSKVMWSLKLVQFSEIMKRFPDFWIQNLSLTRGKGSSPGVVSLSVNAMGSDLREVARFRDAIKHDANFFYHFGDLESDTVRTTPLRGFQNASEQMSFNVKLPMSSGGGDDDNKGRRGRRGRR